MAQVLVIGAGTPIPTAERWGSAFVVEARGENFAQCGTLGAAAMAGEAGVKKLALVHVGPRLAAPGAMEKGIAGVARVYDGDIVFARELMSIQL